MPVVQVRMTTHSLAVVHTLALAFINFLWNYSDYSHAITATDDVRGTLALSQTVWFCSMLAVLLLPGIGGCHGAVLHVALLQL